VSAVLDLPLVLVVDDEVRSQDAIRRTLDEDFTHAHRQQCRRGTRLLLERMRSASSCATSACPARPAWCS
jgi:hypothetical protein